MLIAITVKVTKHLSIMQTLTVEPITKTFNNNNNKNEHCDGGGGGSGHRERGHGSWNGNKHHD